MLPELAPEEIAAAVDDVAAEWLARHDWHGPPVDALQLAARMGLALAWDDAQHGRARFVRLAAGRIGKLDVSGANAARGAILLRPEPREERRQWAVAHEIGETLAEHVFQRLGIDPRCGPPAGRESLANRLASALLLPLAWFVADGGRFDWDLPRLKERYGTASHELIARRMLDAPPAVIVTIFDQGRITFRAGNLPIRPPAPSETERACQRDAHHSGRPRTIQRGQLLARAWPIHEPGWKREIVHAAIPCDGE